MGCFATAMQAQSLKAFLSAGEEAVESGDHYNALYYYDNALEFDSTNLEVRYQFAQAARHFNAYKLAEEHYQYIVDNDTESAYLTSVFYLANMQQRQGKYDQALMNYNLYLSHPEGDELIERAEKEIAAIDFAKQEIENPRPGFTIERLDNNVNTPYSEFGAYEKEGQLFYSSLRFEKEEKEYRIPRIYSKILSSSEGDISAPVNGEINESPEHIAHSAFNHDGTRIYYTICAYADNMNIICDLYYREIDEEMNFGEAVRLPDHINPENSTSTQPSVAFDYKTQKETLFFTSNMEGAKANSMDIWAAEITEDGFGAPVNLTAINTNYDEMAPFYHSGSSTLYFSSDSYLGLGGFDIYKTYTDDEGEYTAPENMGAPVNSSFNDLYYALNEEGDKAYLSSNRTGSLYLEDSYEACCYDIYNVDIEEVKISLEVLTFNEETKDPLPGVNVKIIDLVKDEIAFESFNETSHEHYFDVICGREYIIVSEKNGYDSDTTSLMIRECDTTQKITKKVYLKPQIIKLEVFTYNKRTLEDLPGTTVILEDLSDSTVQIITQTNLESNDFYFDIVAGHKYRITGSKTGFSTETIISETNDIEDGKIVRKLYLLSLNDYLPIAVYFDNDYPDPRTRKMYTESTYSSTFDPYMAKQDEFVSSFVGDMDATDTEKQKAEDEINSFFDNNVQLGYDKMMHFVGLLKSRLEAGDIIEITLKGFASPRAANKYNLALGQRRIWTIKNELKEFNNGELAPFIENEQLLVTEVSFGEEIAPAGISDSYSNRRLSVYSVEASLQRRCEIVKVRILNNE